MNLREIVFRHVEDDGDGLQLRDDGDRRRATRKHNVAGIDQSQTNAAGNRRLDMAIAQLNLRITDLPFVVLHGAAILLDGKPLIFVSLTRNGLLTRRFLIARQIHLGLCKHRAIMLQRAFGLLQLGLITARIDIDQRISPLHPSALPRNARLQPFHSPGYRRSPSRRV